MAAHSWHEDEFNEMAKDLYYASLLIEEIRDENLTQVKRLLEVSKACPNTVVPEHGVAAMHLLGGLQNEDFSSVVVLHVLLQCGGDPNVRSEEGLTPVHVAAMWGRCRVLELLLSNGGDPYLVDYTLGLNAEDYALKESQWKAYGILGTFMAIAEDEDRFAKYLDEGDHCATRGPKCLNNKQNSVQGLEKIYEDVEGYDDNDWLRKTKETLKLDDSSIRIIKNQRRRTNIYEYSGSEHDSDNCKPKCKSRMKRQDDSEMYFCRFTENSYKSKMPSSSSAFIETPRTATRSSDKILCKVSRIFLFMLKKRHIYQRIK